MTMKEIDMDRQWRLDKRVPLAPIVAIVVQTVAVVWFAAGLYNRVATLEEKAVSYAPQSERIIRLETKMENIQEGIGEIKVMIRARQPTNP